jgi:hypothetical protein
MGFNCTIEKKSFILIVTLKGKAVAFHWKQTIACLTSLMTSPAANLPSIPDEKNRAMPSNQY